MPIKLDPQTLAFPVAGLHEGVGYDLQPPGTTPDALNVRAYDAIKRRLRGGRRAGLSRWYNGAINGSNPIQAMASVIDSSPSDATTATFDSVVTDDFSAYAVAANAKWLGNYIPLNMGVNAGTGGLSHATSGLGFGIGSGPTRVLMQSGTTGHDQFLMSTYASTNVIDVTFYAHNAISPGNLSFASPALFVQMSPIAAGYIQAHMTGSGTNAQIVIQKRAAAGGLSTLGTSGNIPLGTADSSTLTSDFRMVLDGSDPGGIITCTVYWPSKAALDSRWGTGFSLSVVDTTLIANKNVAMGVNDKGVGGTTAAVLSATFTRKIPATISPLLTITKNDVTSPVPSRYFVPSGVFSFDLEPLTSSKVLTTKTGVNSQSSDPLWATIDTTNKALEGNTTVNTAGASARVTAMTFAADPVSGVQYILETKAKDASTTTDVICFISRLSTDSLNFLIVELNHSTSDNSESSVPSNFFVSAIVNGIRTNLASIAFGSTNAGPWIGDSNTWMRWTDDGTTIKLFCNNQLLWSYVPSSSANWASSGASTAAFGNKVAGAIVGTDANAMRFLAVDTGTNANTRSSRLVVASGGNVYTVNRSVVASPTSGTNALTTGLFDVQFQPAYAKVFMVDGQSTRYYDLATNTIYDWDATAGSTPQQGRLLALYRGRMVISGVASEPYNWFMSASGRPFDFDYSPVTPNALQAVAGNNSDVGLIGDVVTALIPVGDDVLIFGGDHTIYAMTGDPAAGGTIDLISDKTGIAFGRAWAKDPNGTVYFWGRNGVYRLNPAAGAKPEPMTQGRLDQRLKDIDLTNSRILMEWDAYLAALVILVISSDSATNDRVFVWESRVDAWWEDQYPISMKPTAIYAYDSDEANDQAVLMGGFDSVIRRIDTDAETDDVTVIQNHVRFAPFIAPSRSSEVVLNSVMPVLAEGSGIMSLNVYTGQSAEECVLSTTPRVSRLVNHAGRNGSMRQKVRGYAVQLELTQTIATLSQLGGTKWAMESLTVGFEEGGMPRQEVRANGG